MEDAWDYYCENVWPEEALEAGLDPDGEPNETMFEAWYSGMADYMADRFEER